MAEQKQNDQAPAEGLLARLVLEQAAEHLSAVPHHRSPADSARCPGKFHPTPSQEGAEKIKDILADGLDEYAVNLKKIMDSGVAGGVPGRAQTVDDSRHVGERGRALLKRETLGPLAREARAAAMR